MTPESPTRTSRVRSMPVHSAKFLPAKNGVDTFRRTYAPLLETSDFNCLLSLIEKGEIEVVIDRDTRSPALIARPSVKKFVDSVFDSLMDDQVLV